MSDSFRIDQRRRWEQGERVLVEAYLEQLPGLRSEPEEVLALIEHEVVLRQEMGETPHLEEYLGRFPQLAHDLRLHFQVHDALRTEPLPRPTLVGRARAGGRPAGDRPALPGYEVLGELGRGGMGVVYKARQVALDRVVAVKMILAGSHAGAEERARFRREAEAAARLHHPHVVQIYEVGEAEGRPYLALEYVDGGSLDRRTAGTPQPAAAAARLVETLAQAVQYAHERGIVHRDLKPSNVLLQESTTGDTGDTGKDRSRHTNGLVSSSSGASVVHSTIPKIADFGLAKRLDGGPGPTQSGDLLGTPSYMAPEQAEGKSGTTGPATDVYGLGAILYELLTGRPPFKAETPLDTLLQVRSEEPVSPSQLQPHCPRDLATICLKCLHKEPRRRYPCAVALAEDLRRFLDGKPIRARPVGAAERALKWARRHPATTAWMGLVVLLTGLGFTAVTWYALRAEERRREAEQAQFAAQQARAGAESALYSQRIAGAYREWQACSLEQAELLLRPYAGQEQPPWEWGYVHGLCHTDLLTLGGHAGPVTSVVFSPDGRRLASGSGGAAAAGAIRLWDAATGRLLLTCQGRMAPVTGLAFHPDGRQLASAHAALTSGIPGGVMLWDATTGEAIGPLTGLPGDVSSVAFSPDGRLLATAAGGDVRLWDATTRREAAALSRDGGHAVSVAFSPDGHRLASGGPDGGLRIWDVATQQRLHRLGGPLEIRSVAFSPDGRYLAADRKGHTVEVWDATRGVGLLTHPVHAGPVQSVTFRPDGLWLASADEAGLVQVYEALRWGERRTLRGHTGAVRAVAFSPDGARLATAGSDGAVKVWDALRDQEFRRLPRQGAHVNGLAYSPDGRSLAAAGPMTGGQSREANEARVCDVASGQVRLTLKGHGDTTTGVAYSPDGTRLASASMDRTVRLWDAATGKHLATLEGHTRAVFRVAFDPAGVRLASASEDQTVRIWDVPGGRELHTLRGHAGPVTDVAFGPGGRLLASAGEDGTVRLWDAAARRPLRRLPAHEGPATGVAFSPDGAWLASAGLDRTVALWEVATGREQFRRGHTGEVSAVAFSPDGRRLASASVDNTVKLWDVPTGAEAFTLRGPFNCARSVAFRPDGRQLAVGAAGQTWVGLWDVEAPREVRVARAARAARDWHEGAAAASEAGGRWFAAAFHLSHLLAAQPEGAELYVRRGRAFAELGRWDRAGADHTQAIALGATGARVWHAQALLRLRDGDLVGYRMACKNALEGFGAAPSAADANRVAWTCALAPGAGVDPARVVAVAEQAVAAEPGRHACLNTRGAALYRASRLAEAVRRLEEARQAHRKGGDVEDWLFLALAQHRLGRRAEARQWLERAVRSLETGPPAMEWGQRLARQLLRREAEALLQGAKP